MSSAANEEPPAVKQALAAYDGRDWAAAERLCREVLQADPDCFEVLNLLGIITAQTNRLPEAAEVLRRAGAVRPGGVSVHVNLGNVLAQLGRFDEAVASYDRALQISPRSPVVHAARGAALKASGRPDAALESYDRAVALKPDYAEAWVNRGNALSALGRVEPAVASYDRAIAINPNYAQAHFNRGVALEALERLDAAVAAYERAIALKPDYAEAWSNRGNALRAQGKARVSLDCYDRAVALKPEFAEAWYNRGIVLEALRQRGQADASYRRAIALNPSHARAWSNLGSLQHALGRFDEAVSSYTKAIEIDPGFAEAYANRAISLTALKKIDVAIADFDRAMAIKPDDPAAHFGKAVALLMGGDLENGWAHFEWRWKLARAGPLPRDFSQPLWLGAEPIAGKTILLHAEQGMGDTIQFCRYAKLVADRGARVILEAEEPLLPLLATLEGVSHLVATGSPLPPFDCHCPLASLPLAFGTAISSIPASVPYLRSDPAKSDYWRRRLGTRTMMRVGLVWSGGFRPDQPESLDVNERRNIDLARLAALRDSRAAFYSLQKGEPAASEVARLQALSWDGPEIVDFTPELRDFSDTAALIDNLDLVISVDTATAHLVGAMGRPVWILNRFDNCWRWLIDREDSPWYPTARIYRQRTPGDWEGVVARVKRDLQALLPP
jgi:tetratricopeptide (TPR) repeat protein